VAALDRPRCVSQGSLKRSFGTGIRRSESKQEWCDRRVPAVLAARRGRVEIRRVIEISFCRKFKNIAVIR
jgi:hypothetical protein